MNNFATLDKQISSQFLHCSLSKSNMAFHKLNPVNSLSLISVFRAPILYEEISVSWGATWTLLESM